MLLKVEDVANSSTSYEKEVSTTVANAWEDLTFDYTAVNTTAAFNKANATTDFHVYKLDWTATAINIYVDDVLFQSVPNSNSIPFNHNFFLILNVNMGGTFGGSVDPAVTSGIMEVDYVRVYK